MRRIASWLWSKRSVAVFLSAALASLPGAVRTVRRALELAPLPYDDRRVALMGSFYESTRALNRSIPADEPVAILLRGPDALDRGIFVNYYFYPRRSLLYDFLPADAPRYAVVVEREGPVRSTIIDAPFALSPPQRTFFVPFVAAFHGADAYATEGMLVAERDARVTLELLPARLTKTLFIRAGTPLVFGDVVFENFHALDTGWLRVSATAPIRAGFRFVNRGREVFAPLPVVTSVGNVRIAGGEKLWVVNPFVDAVIVRVNGREVILGPSAQHSFPASTFEGTAFAFTTEKLPDGNTRFRWPEGVR